MAKRGPVIQDIAVVAVVKTGSPVGEALSKRISPMTLLEREDTILRLETSIGQLIDEADTIAYQAGCYKPGAMEGNPDYVIRLSTNEFFFYTQEPLTLDEFEVLQNRIAAKAGTISPRIQLILGSFAVKTADGKVMNVTPHITCGQSPSFHFIVKNHTSPIDVRYSELAKNGDINILQMLDNKNPGLSMPKITINGASREFSFNNIVPCKTLEGTPFLTAVDICLDHTVGVAKKNYEALAKENPDISSQPISHVVVSNSVSLNRDSYVDSNVMHIDPRLSPRSCMWGISQKEEPERKLAFGNDYVRTYKVNPQKFFYHEHVVSNYAYSTHDPSAGRDHKSYSASILTAEYKKSVSTDEFRVFKSKYHDHKGDYLKTQILDSLKNQIQKTSSKKELDELKEKIESSFEHGVLKTGQGWFTRVTGIKTSSLKALESMFEQQEKYLEESCDTTKKTRY